MSGFYLTRTEMGSLLQAIRNQEAPFQVIETACNRSGNSADISEIIPKLPSIFGKLLKLGKEAFGLSINEIVSLGNQLEYASFRSTAVQNWVKRDIKDWIGSPQLGKKYSIEQAAILFIVEDLKNTHDFESIRLLLRYAFNNPADRNDDLIDPVIFYTAYAELFEAIHSELNLSKNDFTEKARALTIIFNHLTLSQREDIEKLLISAALSVQGAYYQTLSKHYLEEVWK
ncbi:DUF1836 domain-containing protein [Alkalihalobacillus macyae]|uniref:DUF1836 domain-containing protein n=1 Tax=Guptibacillus hwajinpoensis TaxID=208199 RepID=UPI00273C2CF4|nr:DUF1836 domain-containing protein [Alkalihalobacillus macyae]MDP4551824.1 DUF1836 domain-containing protein [Alkalihalobacillus macyae]